MFSPQAGRGTYAAFSFFGGADSAPEFLISAMSLAENLSTSFKISSVCSPKSGERFTSEIEFGQLDRIADGQILAARRVVDLDHRAGVAQRHVLGDLLHRQDRADRNVDLVADFHDLELALGHGPLFDGIEDVLEARQPRRRRGVVRIGLPFRLADDVADLLPHRRLGDEVDVGVGVGLPAFALQNPARLAAAGIVAGARRGFAEGHVLAVLAVFLERPVLSGAAGRAA